jgi:hypothetical protein
VAVRLRLVHEMNCEVRRDSEAALRESDVSFGNAAASRSRGAAAVTQAAKSEPCLGEPDASISRAMEQRLGRALEEVSRRWDRDDGSAGIKLDVGPLLRTTGVSARPATRKPRPTARSKALSWEASAAHLERRDETGLDRWEAICTRGTEMPAGNMPELEWLSLFPLATDRWSTFPQEDAYPSPGPDDAEVVRQPGADGPTGCDGADGPTGCELDEKDSAEDGRIFDRPAAAPVYVAPACQSLSEAQPQNLPELASQHAREPAPFKCSPAASDEDELQPTVLRRLKVRSRRRVVDCSSSDDDFQPPPRPVESRGDFEPPPRPVESRGAPAPCSPECPTSAAEESRTPAEPPERNPLRDAPLLVPIRAGVLISDARGCGAVVGSGSRRSFRRKTIEANLEPLPDERAPSRRDESVEGLVLDPKVGWKFLLPPEATDSKLRAKMFEPVCA